MSEYQYNCKDCGYKTNKKSSYAKHIKKGKSCGETTEKYWCNICKIYIEGLDTYKTHNKIHNKKYDRENAIDPNPYDNLRPFKTYDLNDLSGDDVMDIFSSGNIIERVICKFHLDENKKQYHNCGLTELDSGYAIVYDGYRWKKIPDSEFFNILIEFGHKHCTELYRRIRDFLSADSQKHIENQLETYAYNNIDIPVPLFQVEDEDIANNNFILHFRDDITRQYVVDQLHKSKH